MKKTRWSKQEVAVLKNNYQKMPRKELIKLLPNRTLAGINVKARSLNLQNYEGNHSWHSTITYNKNYFSEVNSDSSYWAGFIAADGYIDTKNNKLRLKLSAKDKCHLELFAKCLSFSGNIREYVRDTNLGKNYPTVYIDLCGASQIIKDLKTNFNIGIRKSLTLKPPTNINTLHSLAYLKGLIDGDGSISKSGDKFELLATKYISDWVIRLFKDLEYDIRIRPHRKTEGLFITYKTNLNVLYLINNSTTLSLKRKWNRVPLVSNN